MDIENLHSGQEFKDNGLDNEKIDPLSLVLANYTLLTDTPSRLNLTSFQSGLDWVPDVK